MFASQEGLISERTVQRQDQGRIAAAVSCRGLGTLQPGLLSNAGATESCLATQKRVTPSA